MPGIKTVSFRPATTIEQMKGAVAHVPCPRPYSLPQFRFRELSQVENSQHTAQALKTKLGSLASYIHQIGQKVQGLAKKIPAHLIDANASAPTGLFARVIRAFEKRWYADSIRAYTQLSERQAAYLEAQTAESSKYQKLLSDIEREKEEAIQRSYPITTLKKEGVNNSASSQEGVMQGVANFISATLSWASSWFGSKP
jgi:hypothetical protein